MKINPRYTGSTAQHWTAYHTTPHSTAPHRTAPHRTALHASTHTRVLYPVICQPTPNAADIKHSQLKKKKSSKAVIDPAAADGSGEGVEAADAEKAKLKKTKSMKKKTPIKVVRQVQWVEIRYHCAPPY